MEPMSTKRKYPSTELSTGLCFLITRLVGPLEARGISRATFRDILAEANITVSKSSLDRWVSAHISNASIYPKRKVVEPHHFLMTINVRLRLDGFCFFTPPTKWFLLPHSRISAPMPFTLPSPREHRATTCMPLASVRKFRR